MGDFVARYTPIREHLPAVYQGNESSWHQVSGYLDLVDHLHREYVKELDQLLLLLTPNEYDETLPPDITPRTNKDQVYSRIKEIIDWQAALMGFSFPPSWRQENQEEELRHKAHFVLRAHSFWRRKSTPTGFLAWFCYYFQLFQDKYRPLLIEHFKYRPDTVPEDEDRYTWRVSLLVPLFPETIYSFSRRKEVEQFVSDYAPAHLMVRICWVSEQWKNDVIDNLSDNTDWIRSKVIESNQHFFPTDLAITVQEEAGGPSEDDRLNLGHLPGGTG